MKHNNLLIGFASLLITFFFATYSFAGCLSFVPYGYNGKYVRLPKNAEFCVDAGDGEIEYKTDEMGGRIIAGLEAGSGVRLLFGESQLLELDNPGTSFEHTLRQIYPKEELHLYAAPNNGPFEALEYVKDVLKKEKGGALTIGFNFATDIFRILPYWNVDDFVALNSEEADIALYFPLYYDVKILLGIVQGKYFSIKKVNNKYMQRIFLEDDLNYYIKYWRYYLKEFSSVVEKYNVAVDFIFYPPYWGYDTSEKGSLYLNKPILKLYRDFVCNSFTEISMEKTNVFIGKMRASAFRKDAFTADAHHFRYQFLKIEEETSFCSGAF